jgi:hypothetical protein
VLQFLTYLFIAIYTATVIGIILVVILGNRNPLKTIPWVVVLIFAPVVGLVFYFFFGQDLRRKRIISRRTYKRQCRLTRAFRPVNFNDSPLRIPATQRNIYTDTGPETFPMTPQGQVDFLRALNQTVQSVPNGRGLGVIYWEPDFIPVKDAGWKAGAGDEWDNVTLFDFQGNVLPGLSALGAKE